MDLEKKDYEKQAGGILSSSRPRTDPHTVYEVIRSLTQLTGPDELLHRVGEHLRQLFGADLVLLLLTEPQRGDFTPVYNLGYDEAALSGLAFAARGRLAQWLASTPDCQEFEYELRAVEQMDLAERDLLARLRVRICLPLVSLNRMIGILLLGSADPDWELSGEDRELVKTLAAHVALALENALLYGQQKERLRRLYLNERLATAGQLAAGVAHEIRNPLTVIGSTLGYIAQGLAEEDPKRHLVRELLDEVARIRQTTEALLNLSRTRDSSRSEINVLAVLDQALLLIEGEVKQRGLKLEKHYDADRYMVSGDPAQLKQVFLNLLLNAVQSMGQDGGTVSVHAGPWRSPYAPDSDWRVQIEITDQGCGIREEDLERIFDTFFTTKRAGTGLGLAICQSIVGRHEGEVDVSSTPEEGTTFCLRLPLLR